MIQKGLRNQIPIVGKDQRTRFKYSGKHFNVWGWGGKNTCSLTSQKNVISRLLKSILERCKANQIFFFFLLKPEGNCSYKALELCDHADKTHWSMKLNKCVKNNTKGLNKRETEILPANTINSHWDLFSGVSCPFSSCLLHMLLFLCPG